MVTNKQLLKKIVKKAQKIQQNPQDLLQMYFFERLLYRISISPYKYNFILKGGLLLSAIIGVERRTSKDMDTMIKGFDIASETLIEVLNQIININVNDDISFQIIRTTEIREDDIYGGTNISLIAKKENLKVPLNIDITTKDPITPREIEFGYKCLLDDSIIPIMAFNKETILAEKFIPTIQKLETNNKRIKDFLDMYILLTEFENEINPDILQRAIINTCRRRDCLPLLDELHERIDIIENSNILKNYWKNYQKENKTATSVSFNQVTEILKRITKIVEKDSVKKKKELN